MSETKITKKQWLTEVKQEIDNIKKFATQEEITNLDIEDFDPNYYSRCVYGQMSGHCRNDRGIELIKSCCIRYTKPRDINSFESRISETFEKSKEQINGTEVEGIGRGNDIVYFSALEHYILLKGSNNKGVIKYLKGEQKTLKL